MLAGFLTTYLPEMTIVYSNRGYKELQKFTLHFLNATKQKEPWIKFTINKNKIVIFTLSCTMMKKGQTYLKIIFHQYMKWFKVFPRLIYLVSSKPSNKSLTTFQKVFILWKCHVLAGEYYTCYCLLKRVIRYIYTVIFSANPIRCQWYRVCWAILSEDFMLS